MCGTVICVHYVTTSEDAPPLTDDRPGQRHPRPGGPRARQRRAGPRDVRRRGLPPARPGRVARRRQRPGRRLPRRDRRPEPLRLLHHRPAGEVRRHVQLLGLLRDRRRLRRLPEHARRRTSRSRSRTSTSTPSSSPTTPTESAWFLEATATWAEDEVFDSVNDNWNYLEYGQMGDPCTPLNTFSGPGPLRQLDLLPLPHREVPGPDRQHAQPGARDDPARQQPDGPARRERDAGDPEGARTSAGRRSATAYQQFAVANRAPKKSYDEGRNYRPRARPIKTFRLSSSNRNTGRWFARVRHLTNLPVRFKPGAGTEPATGSSGSRWTCRRRTPAPAARVIVYQEVGQGRRVDHPAEPEDHRQQDGVVQLAVGQARRAGAHQLERQRQQGQDGVQRPDLPELNRSDVRPWPGRRAQSSASRARALRTTAGSVVDHIGARLARRNPP